MKKYFSLIIIGLCFVGCQQNQNDISTPPQITPIVVDTDQCPAAEQHLHDLCNINSTQNSYCCQVVSLTKKGKTYTQFCQTEQNEGIYLNPKCIESITSCDQIDACTHSN